MKYLSQPLICVRWEAVTEDSDWLSSGFCKMRESIRQMQKDSRNLIVLIFPCCFVFLMYINYCKIWKHRYACMQTFLELSSCVEQSAKHLYVLSNLILTMTL